MTQNLTTRLIHHPYQPPAGFGAIPLAVHKGSTVLFESCAAMRARSWKSRAGYTYGLQGTPTTFALEERIATIEGGRFCSLAPSGLAAITMVNLGLLKPGDELLLPANVYGPSKEQAKTLLARMGIGWAEYDPLNVASLAETMSPHTRLVWLEAPGSVTMEFPDLRSLIAAAKRPGVVTALDNTWGAGIAFAPFALGVDVTVHALTKYPSGGGDVLMGAVVTSDEALHHAMLHAHMVMGIGVAANDAELVLRGLPSMAVRYAAHDIAARELAAWLGTRPEVRQVLHPALAGSPGHAHWKSHCTGAAGLFSVMFDPRFTQAQVDTFCEALKLFGIGFSWGGPMSLAVPYDITAMRSGSLRHPGHLVRFSIGLEAVGDLQADLAQALEKAFG